MESAITVELLVLREINAMLAVSSSTPLSL
jgi:hypothetical protein